MKINVPYFVIWAKAYNNFFEKCYYNPIFVELRFYANEFRYTFLLYSNLLLDVPKELENEKN